MNKPKHHETMTDITLEKLSSFVTPREVDTLMLSKLLRQFNFSEPQAEVISELIKQNNICAEKIITNKIATHKE